MDQIVNIIPIIIFVSLGIGAFLSFEREVPINNINLNDDMQKELKRLALKSGGAGVVLGIVAGNFSETIRTFPSLDSILQLLIAIVVAVYSQRIFSRINSLCKQ
jgi:hypothetical protein